VKYIFNLLNLILILLSLPFYGLAQEPVKFDLMKDNIETMLPPLETLIDSALTNNPHVKFRDLQISVNENKLNADRSQWARNVGIQSDIRYGTFNNFSMNTAEGQSPSNFATQTNQFVYGAGAYIKFPIFDILNRKNQVDLAKFEVGQAQSMAAVQRNEVRQSVVIQYNQVILTHRLLRNKSKYIESARVNMEMAENEFHNGVIPVGEYTRISEIVSRAEADFETARADFITSFMILEEIIGYKLNLNYTVNTVNENH
jgi:outer membrane protein TolC